MMQQSRYPQLGLLVNKTCKVCGSPLKSDKIDLREEKGSHHFIMEDVPVYVCENCDEIWVPEAVMDRFKSYTQLRSVKYGGRKDHHRKIEA